METTPAFGLLRGALVAAIASRPLVIFSVPLQWIMSAFSGYRDGKNW